MKDDDVNDADLNAFLAGEGALAQALQEMPQPTPPDALDAAIMARARAEMAQEGRPEAANDARAYGRWRVPAGIAATVLAGVLGHQAWRASSDAERAAAVRMAEQVQAPAVVSPTVQSDVVMSKKGEPAAQPQKREATPVKAAPPVRAAIAPAVPPPPPIAVPHVEATVAASPQSVPALAAAPAQPPAPAPAPAQPLAPAPAPALAPAQPFARASTDDAMRTQMARRVAAQTEKVAPPSYARTVASALAEQKAEAKAEQKAATVHVEVTGSRVRAEPSAADWQKRIGDLLAAGDKQRALTEWAAYRDAYPDVVVPAPLAAAIKAAQE